MTSYNVGTITLTAGSPTVTGAGGLDFSTNALAGWLLRDRASGLVYPILSVDSATQLTLEDNALAASAGAGRAYSIVPASSPVRDLVVRTSQLLDQFSAVRDGAGAGKFADGSGAAPGMRFAAEEGTGVLRPAAGVLGFATVGTERARLNANGLAIGSTSVGAALHVKAAGSNAMFKFVAASDAAGYGSFTNAAGATVGYLGNGGGGALSAGTGSDFCVRGEGDLMFARGNTEIARFDQYRRLLVGNSLSDGSAATLQAFQPQSGDAGSAFSAIASSVGFTYAIARLNAYRGASSSFSFAEFYSANYGDAKFRFRGDGNGYCDGAWNGGGADFAEFWEWSDGNPDDDDRRGVSVVLDGEKIRPATEADAAADIFGIVSANPSLVGDADVSGWKGKYLRDDFGAWVWEDYQVASWTEQQLVTPGVAEILAHFDSEGLLVPTIPAVPPVYRSVDVAYAIDDVPAGVVVPPDATLSTQQRQLLNPEFDPDQDYVAREDRPEWAWVGEVGKLRLRKGQPVGDRWRKMRDISSTVEEWLVR